MKLTKILAGASVVAALALFVVACSSSPGTGVGPSLVSGGSLATIVGGEDCSNGKDDDGDKLIDCADPDCAAAPECQKPPTGTGCSPGFFKNHQETWVGTCCTDATTPSCASLLTALTCKGSDASCGRSAAAAFLNACTGCTESD